MIKYALQLIQALFCIHQWEFHQMNSTEVLWTCSKCGGIYVHSFFDNI